MEISARVMQKIEKIRIKLDLKKSKLASVAGYTGGSSSQSASYSKLAEGKKNLTIANINGIAQFLELPVGYFLFEEINSPITIIDEDTILEYLKIFFIEQDTQPKKQRKTRTQFGKRVGYADDTTAQFNTAKRILTKKSKITLEILWKIAEFIEIPVQEFLEKIHS